MSNNTFQVNDKNGEIVFYTEGQLTVINRLALVDEKTGNKWEIKISDGQLIVEPMELDDKRDVKINKLIND
jgi:uncharacterized protein YxjI